MTQPFICASLLSADLVRGREVGVGQAPGLVPAAETRTALAPAPSPPGRTRRRRGVVAGLAPERTQSQDDLAASLLDLPLLTGRERRRGRPPGPGAVPPRKNVLAPPHQTRRGVLLVARTRRLGPAVALLPRKTDMRSDFVTKYHSRRCSLLFLSSYVTILRRGLCFLGRTRHVL